MQMLLQWKVNQIITCDENFLTAAADVAGAASAVFLRTM